MADMAQPSALESENDTSDSAPGTEPDYRFLLANERTFLAWQRTALGLLAASVGVVQLVPAMSIPGSRHILGLILGALAVLTAGMGLRRWVQSDHAIRRNIALPRQFGPAYLGLGVVIVGLAALVLVVGPAVIG